MPSIPEALQWQAALERELEEVSPNQLTVPYDQVARAFPSQNPHPDTFECDYIDETTFFPWAGARGWKVNISQESSAGETSLPPILFTKIT